MEYLFLVFSLSHLDIPDSVHRDRSAVFLFTLMVPSILIVVCHLREVYLRQISRVACLAMF